MDRIGDIAAKVVADARDRTFFRSPPDNPLEHWQRRLAGENIGCEDGHPEQGYYRTRHDRPVAIWWQGDQVLAKVGDKTITDRIKVEELWGRVHPYPVEYEAYEAVAERGEPWPDQHPAVVENDRLQPATGFDLIRHDVETFVAEARKLILCGPAGSEDEASRADALQARLSELEKKADAERKAEKKPHEDAAKAVDARWNPVRDMAADAKREIKARVIGPWLLAKADAERKAREVAAASDDPAARAVAEQAAGEPIKASTKGGRVALRRVHVTKVDDPRAALRWFAERNEDVPADIVTYIERFAKGLYQAGGTVVPGTTTTVEQRAA